MVRRLRPVHITMTEALRTRVIRTSTPTVCSNQMPKSPTVTLASPSVTSVQQLLQQGQVREQPRGRQRKLGPLKAVYNGSLSLRTSRDSGLHTIRALYADYYHSTGRSPDNRPTSTCFSPSTTLERDRAQHASESRTPPHTPETRLRGIIGGFGRNCRFEDRAQLVCSKTMPACTDPRYGRLSANVHLRLLDRNLPTYGLTTSPSSTTYSAV